MRNTVPTAIRKLRVEPDTLGQWAANEVIPALSEARRALNWTSRSLATATTEGDGAWTTIWQSDVMRHNTLWLVTADIMGHSTSGMSVVASYLIRGLFYRTTLFISQQGATTLLSGIESAAACDAAFVISGDSVLVQVRDDAVTAMSWEAIVDQRELPHP